MTLIFWVKLIFIDMSHINGHFFKDVAKITDLECSELLAMFAEDQRRI